MIFPREQYPFRTLVQGGCIVLLVLATVAFIVFQGRNLILGPRITLTTPIQNPHTERTILLEGTAQNISRIWLNDRQIFTNTEGVFRERLILENGFTVATLKAQDRYGRTTTLEFPIVHVAACLIDEEKEV